MTSLTRFAIDEEEYLCFVFNMLVQMTACETHITCIAQVTFKFVNKALLVHTSWLSFSQFEVSLNLLANKYGLYGRQDLLTLIFKLGTNNIS